MILVKIHTKTTTPELTYEISVDPLNETGKATIEFLANMERALKIGHTTGCIGNVRIVTFSIRRIVVAAEPLYPSAYANYEDEVLEHFIQENSLRAKTIDNPSYYGEVFLPAMMKQCGANNVKVEYDPSIDTASTWSIKPTRP